MKALVSVLLVTLTGISECTMQETTCEHLLHRLEVLENQANIQKQINEELLLTIQHQNETIQHQNERLASLESKHDTSEMFFDKRFVLNADGPIGFTVALSPVVVEPMNVKDTVKFETTITDIGGGYNNQSGIFVVPRSGIYIISCSLLDDDGASGVVVHAEIMHNQRVIGRVFADAEPGRYRDQGAQTVITEANQGDQIWIRVIDNSHVELGGELYSTFSGYLLYAF